MSFTVDSAVIMAAGASSRFAPLSYEMPKALLPVRGEILIERQIRQLKEAGVDDIFIVTGYKGGMFSYLRQKFGVTLIENGEYLTRNNNGSIYAAREHIKNTYICSSDNYFASNPFERTVDGAYYAAVFSEGKTDEWCMTEDADGYINGVTIGGENAWYMLGHTFWDENFSARFLSILEREYDLPETRGLLWESIFAAHTDELKMKIRRYPAHEIFEFDTLDELRMFDESYINDTRSEILKNIARTLGCREGDICDITAFRAQNSEAAGFRFLARGERYEYTYETKSLGRVIN